MERAKVDEAWAAGGSQGYDTWGNIDTNLPNAVSYWARRQLDITDGQAGGNPNLVPLSELD
jgi:hypothetical protein